MAELTDEQIAQEEKFLKGIPRVNVGALFLPPIWGPAHGIWITILWYPIWLFADTTFYAAARGVSKEDYLKRERIWAIVCVIVGCAMIAAATYYNLVIRPTLGA